MEWNFEQENGAVVVRQEGERALCHAIRKPDGKGLYKAWLLGKRGEQVLLGTLIPEGGALRLHRAIEVSQLEMQGVWPPAGAEIAMAYTFTRDVLPKDWNWTECPGRLMGDRILMRAMGGIRRALIKRDAEGFFLAFPYSARSPFPITPLYCLSGLKQLSGKWYLLFRFSGQGTPELLHKFSAEGEDRGEI